MTHQRCPKATRPSAGRILASALVLGLAVIGCAADYGPPPQGPPPPGPPPPQAGFLPTPPQLIPSPGARASHVWIGAATNAYLAGDWFATLRLASQLQSIRPFLGLQLKTMTYCQLRDPIRARHSFALFNSVAPGPAQDWRRAALAQLCASAGIGL